MGKIIKTILATEDNDPMDLLGTYDIFSPKRNSKKIVKKNHTDPKLVNKKKLKKWVWIILFKNMNN